ncbi:hypothetical protein BABINDRAFT_6890 [Babjeviella inositovora NRRL Y-12698]|uniref:N-acetyltransferase domain-containing protein n=1 Tax=Babjeviella inositovora NRRL Y-12698 TaxID=984486 RepID=A0A1E3QTN0_9ASCO|nr:uncharacterized protein BABINDRAFT_6890 [Babjeviella inositovora NRRL Y-12698]ODQ81045.1 hypothetical protein BABINDRAFT_6890 [Babjeviella inositovora NRRL Y-12698]
MTKESSVSSPYHSVVHSALTPTFSHDHWDRYYNLRYTVLRQPWQDRLGSERDRSDKEAAVVHVGIFDAARECVACARVEETPESSAAAPTYQVRYVATDDTVRGQGLGRKVMEAVEKCAADAAKQKYALSKVLILLNAREVALGFYEKLGYTLVCKTYLMYGLVQHYQMTKAIEL